MQLTTNAKNTKLQKLAEEKGMEAHQIHHEDDQPEEDKETMDKVRCAAYHTHASAEVIILFLMDRQVYVWKKPGFSVDLKSLKEDATPTPQETSERYGPPP